MNSKKKDDPRRSTTVNLRRSLREKADKLAASTRRSRSWVVETALEQYFRRRERRAA